MPLPTLELRATGPLAAVPGPAAGRVHYQQWWPLPRREGAADGASHLRRHRPGPGVPPRARLAEYRPSPAAGRAARTDRAARLLDLLLNQLPRSEEHTSELQ